MKYENHKSELEISINKISHEMGLKDAEIYDLQQSLTKEVQKSKNEISRLK